MKEKILSTLKSIFVLSLISGLYLFLVLWLICTMNMDRVNSLTDWLPLAAVIGSQAVYAYLFMKLNKNLVSGIAVTAIDIVIYILANMYIIKSFNGWDGLGIALLYMCLGAVILLSDVAMTICVSVMNLIKKVDSGAIPQNGAEAVPQEKKTKKVTVLKSCIQMSVFVLICYVTFVFSAIALRESLWQVACFNIILTAMAYLYMRINRKFAVSIVGLVTAVVLFGGTFVIRNLPYFLYQPEQGQSFSIHLDIGTLFLLGFVMAALLLSIVSWIRMCINPKEDK